MLVDRVPVVVINCGGRPEGVAVCFGKGWINKACAAVDNRYHNMSSVYVGMFPQYTEIT